MAPQRFTESAVISNGLHLSDFLEQSYASIFDVRYVKIRTADIGCSRETCTTSTRPRAAAMPLTVLGARLQQPYVRRLVQLELRIEIY
jgi:hypothetical protein